MKSMLNKRQQLNAPRRKAIALAVAMCFAGEQAWANPTGATVVRGTAPMSAVGSTLTVANSPGAIIHWENFSIDVGETTIFNQVNAASAVLNRVTGGNISQILGALKSNGQVYLINPSGIVFGANSVIDVAGLVASTLNMTDADFLSGKKLFNADTANAGSVINHGEIKTPAGGFVYLLAPKVENNGIITAPSGEAILAAGNSVEIVDSANPMQRVVVSAQSQDVNLSALMTQSNGNIFSVLNTGTVSANTVHQDATGRIFFKSAGSVQTTASSVIEAKGDTLNNGGTFIGFADTVGAYQGKIDARGKNGGFVETSGKYVIGLDSLDLKVSRLDVNGKGGTWLIDPYNITITATTDTNSVITLAGSPYTISSDGINSPTQIAATTIVSRLNSGDSVIIDTDGGGSENGDIAINASIAKTAGGDSTLTFNADGAITMGANVQITDSGSGKLSVTMLSDRDATGSTGGITATYIDVAGDVNLKTNSGGFSFAGGTSFQSVNGANVDLDIAGNVTLQGGTGSSQSNGIYATNGDVKIKAGGAVNLLSGNAATTYTEIRATNKVEIESQGGLTLTGGSANNTVAIISGGGKVSVKSGGDISLSGGTGGTAKAVIESINDDVKIEFSSQRNLTLTGSTSNTGEGFAVIDAFNGDVVIKGDIAAHNPGIVIDGGGSSGLNYAGITGKTISNIRAGDIILTAGQKNSNINMTFGTTGGDAFIAAIGTNANNPAVNINASGTVSLSSELSLDAQSNLIAGAKAEIGSADGVITINANSVVLNSETDSLGNEGIAGIGANSASNVAVNISASGSGSSGVILDGASARIGNAGSGSAVVSLTGVSDNSDAPNGVQIVNGARVGNSTGTGGSVTITGTSTSASSNGGGQGITISDSSINSGNISLNGTGQGPGLSEGVYLDSSSITATSGDVVIVGSSATSTAISLNSTFISANSGTVTLAAPNGSITQNAGGITTTKLNVRALSVNLGSILNSFNSALFDTASLVNVVNGAKGTVNYEFAQNTQWENSGDDASVLNITANNGLTLVGDGSADFDGDNTGTVNFRGSSLKLTNGMSASADNFNIVADSIEIDQGSRIDANTLDIAANKISMDNATINATSDINILTKNLVMNNNSFIGGSSVNINSLPLAFKLAGDDATKQQVRALFARLTKDASLSLTDSFISADNNLNIAASDVNLVGGGLFAANVVTVVSGGNITLTGGSSNSAFISAGEEVLLVAGKQVILNSGASSARVEADSPNTLYMSFPLLAADGYVVDGVANAISNGKSGFFVNGAPAVLDTNFFVAYSGSLSQALLAFVSQNTTNNIVNNTNLELKADKEEVDDKKESQQGECS